MKKDILAKKLENSIAIYEAEGVFVGRIWVPEQKGPSPVAIIAGDIYDFSKLTATSSQLLNQAHPLDFILKFYRSKWVDCLGPLEDVMMNCHPDLRNLARPLLLSPCDLQAIRACGVTFVSSMLERVIDEFARGRSSKAGDLRGSIMEEVGETLSTIRPGSLSSERLKDSLIKRGLWSQYLEVGIGPFAEVFNKAQPMASVGTGSEIGIRSDSRWNNPEPELVLVLNRAGTIIGTTIGNDVNLRDFEGRSALLLGKAKDNNASCSIGPLIRLLDESYTISDAYRTKLEITVHGQDRYDLSGTSDFAQISRDPAELVRQAINRTNQYPDGILLFLGTQFAPTSDRNEIGKGFTHKVGDIVSISCQKLGTLTNRVNLCEKIAPWTFGVGDLMSNLSKRGLI